MTPKRKCNLIQKGKYRILCKEIVLSPIHPAKKGSQSKPTPNKINVVMNNLEFWYTSLLNAIVVMRKIVNAQAVQKSDTLIQSLLISSTTT
jgi:hypothetical protein